MQSNKTCKHCGQLGHSKFYCKSRPKKPIPKVSPKKSVKSKAPKAPSRSKLVKDLDKYYSLYIRNKYAKDGLVQCVTCNETKPIKEMQNGHYESRGHYPTRWLDENCHPQCVTCNVFKKGNYTEYSIYMIKRYGVGILESLKQKANSGEKISTLWIKEMIKYYKSML